MPWKPIRLGTNISPAKALLKMVPHIPFKMNPFSKGMCQFSGWGMFVVDGCSCFQDSKNETGSSGKSETNRKPPDVEPLDWSCLPIRRLQPPSLSLGTSLVKHSCVF